MTKTKSRRRLMLIAVPLLIFLLILGCAAVWFLKIYCPISYEALPLEESTDPIINPYMGWYNLYGYALSDDKEITEEDILSACENDTNTSLALLQINLKNYREGTISEKGLRQLDTIIKTFAGTGRTLVVRFTYDWDGNALSTEPENLETVLHHVEQVSGTVNEYASSIHILQGVFVGAYGEMHGSNFMDADSMCQIMIQLAELTDPSIFLSVRTPAQLRLITQKDDSFADRLGLFNDGMLSSDSDTGTYLSAEDLAQSSETDPSGKKSREEELDFQEELCLSVPNGGEVIIDNPYNDLGNALKDMRRMHVSYLNMGYDTAVLDKWRNTFYTGDSVFQDISGYDYVTAHLGYRYVLQSSSMAFDTFQDDTATYTVDLINSGFSGSYRDFDLTFFLTNQETGDTTELIAESSTSQWLPGEDITVKMPLDVRSMEKGSYEISICLRTQTGTPVLFANKGERDGIFPLGTLTVKK